MKCVCCKKDFETSNMKMISASASENKIECRCVCGECDKRDVDMSIKTEKSDRKFSKKRGIR